MSQQEIQNASKGGLIKMAEEIVELAAKKSSVFDPDEEDIVPKFEQDELTLGRVVGRGGFAIVHEITAIFLKDEESTSSRRSRGKSTGRFTKNDRSESISSESSSTLRFFSSQGSGFGLDADLNQAITSRELMATHMTLGGKPRYVMKSISSSHFKDNKYTYLKGCVDLAMEAKYLTALAHPNILELRGMSAGGLYDTHGPFLILDRLHATLPRLMKDWMKTDRQCKGVTGVFAGSKKKSSSLLMDRLKVAFDIASALSYLHGLRVIYRDLKPDNIGFDIKGNCKIFDFGLAKELKKEDRREDGLYLLTGFTGSIRYMAPEVGRKEPYNEKADLYSFGMLFWYMMALEPPYAFYTDQMFIDRVFVRGARPVAKDSWPEEVSKLMKQCWDSDLKKRPSFHEVMKTLKEVVASADPVAADLMTLEVLTLEDDGE